MFKSQHCSIDYPVGGLKPNLGVYLTDPWFSHDYTHTVRVGWGIALRILVTPESQSKNGLDS